MHRGGGAHSGRRGHLRAGSQWPPHSDGRALRGDQGDGGGLLLHRGARPERGDPGGRAPPGRAAGNGGSPAVPRPRGGRRAAEGIEQTALTDFSLNPSQETTMRFMVMVKATKDSEAGVMPDEKLLADM